MDVNNRLSEIYYKYQFISWYYLFIIRLSFSSYCNSWIGSLKTKNQLLSTSHLWNLFVLVHQIKFSSETSFLVENSILATLLTLAQKPSSSSGTGKAVAFPTIRKVGKSGKIRQGIFGNAWYYHRSIFFRQNVFLSWKMVCFCKYNSAHENRFPEYFHVLCVKL